MFARFLEYFEGQPSDESRSIEGDGYVCERNEERHDIKGIDMVRPDSTGIDFLSANS